MNGLPAAMRKPDVLQVVLRVTEEQATAVPWSALDVFVKHSLSNQLDIDDPEWRSYPAIDFAWYELMTNTYVFLRQVFPDGEVVR